MHSFSKGPVLGLFPSPTDSRPQYSKCSERNYFARRAFSCATHQPGVAVSLITLVIILIAVGVLLWAANTYLPMDPKIKSLLNIVVIIAIVLWLLGVFGLLEPLHAIRVGT